MPPNLGRSRHRDYPEHEVLPPTPVDWSHPCHCGRISLPFGHTLSAHNEFRAWWRRTGGLYAKPVK